MRVLGRRVLIRPAPHAEKIGLIVVPERAKQTPQEGIVEAIGDQVTTIRLGERVLYGRYTGVSVDGGRLLLWDRDVMAILDPAPQ